MVGRHVGIGAGAMGGIAQMLLQSRRAAGIAQPLIGMAGFVRPQAQRAFIGADPSGAGHQCGRQEGAQPSLLETGAVGCERLRASRRMEDCGRDGGDRRGVAHVLVGDVVDRCGPWCDRAAGISELRTGRRCQMPAVGCVHHILPADLDDAAMGGVAAAGFQIDDPDIGGGLGGQGTVHLTSVGTGGGIPKSNR